MSAPRPLTLTPAVLAALGAVDAAEQDYVPGRDPASEVDVHKIRLADAVREALAAQRLARLPQRAARRGRVLRRKVGA